jgi:hypothetical protein
LPIDNRPDHVNELEVSRDWESAPPGRNPDWHSLEKYRKPARGVVLKDEFDLPNKPCQWTPFDRKYALMQRDPLVKSFGKTLKKFLKSLNDSDLESEAENLKEQIRKKWAVRIYIPEPTIQGLTDFWFPTALEVHASVEDARGNSSMVLQGNENTGFKITRTSFQENNLIYCESHKIPTIIDPSLLTLNDAQLVKNAVW